LKTFFLFRSDLFSLEYYHQYKQLDEFKRKCHDYYLLFSLWLLERDYFDQVYIIRLTKKPIPDIVFNVNGKLFIQTWVKNLNEVLKLPKPKISFFRGGFRIYDEFVSRNPKFSDLTLYLGAGRRILPQWGGKYDAFLMEDERDFVKNKKCIPFYKTASPEIFHPIKNSEVKWDICWPCNFTQIKFKGQREFIKMISQRPKLREFSIIHCGNKPEQGKKLCKQYKVDNIEFIGHVTRPELNKILNQSKFGLNLSNLQDGCPRVSTEILMSGTPLLLSETVRLLDYFRSNGVINITPLSIVSRLAKALYRYNDVKNDILNAVKNEFSFDIVNKKNIDLWNNL